jgi:uncharacterized membrane protein
MSWIFRYRCRAFLRSSLAAPAIAAIAMALIIAPLVRSVDDRTRWALLDFGIDGSRAVIGALAGSILTFIVFAFSIVLLAVQVAGGQLSPRIIARVLQNHLVRLMLGTFSFSFAYSLTVLGRIEDRVPQLSVLIASIASVISIVMFIYAMQRAGQALRHGVILEHVAADTRVSISKVYPVAFDANAGAYADFRSSQSSGTVRYTGRPGKVMAFDAAELVRIAVQSKFTLELVPRVGDFLAAGDDMFHVYATHSGTALAVDHEKLQNCVATGLEQWLDDDPVFGLRILVEIACKALSPAINDPVTGVLAIDQIEHVLRLLGSRHLETGTVLDSSGTVRLVYRTPKWEDYVSLGVTEIRIFGATDPQLSRRLMAMLEGLMRTLPSQRSAVLQKEIALLRRTIERTFADPEERALAGVADRQGFGSRC